MSPQRIWVFDNPRTRSHIFFRLFSQHPQLEQIYRPYMYASFMGPERVLDHLRHCEARTQEIKAWWDALGLPDTYESSTKALESNIKEAESKGKIVFGNEHVDFAMKLEPLLALTRNEPVTIESNPTHFPDEIFDTLTPIFLIRDPVLQVPSAYRSYIREVAITLDDEDFVCTVTNRYQRALFDYFKSKTGKAPIVVNAEDTIYDTKEVTDKICNALGIDPEGVKQTWDPVPEEQWPQNPIVLSLTKTLLTSSGVEREAKRPPVPDLEHESKRWAENYGEEDAHKLKEFIKTEMPNYEYLSSFKL